MIASTPVGATMCRRFVWQEELKLKASEATASQSEAEAALAQRAELHALQAAMEGELAHLKV